MEIMYTMPLFGIRRTSIFAVSLMPLLVISFLSVGVPFAPVQTAPMAANLAKISPTLLEKVTAEGNSLVNVLIETRTSDYSSVVTNINDLEGKVGYQCKYVNALSATIPADKVAMLTLNEDIVKISYDEERTPASDPGEFLMPAEGLGDLDQLLAEPTLLETQGFEPTSITLEELLASDPSNYWNPWGMGAATSHVWRDTNYGQGSLAVIIDTGIWTGHFMFAGTNIMGGVDLSFDVGKPLYEGWSNPLNHFHGGHVAGILASTGGIIVPNTSILARSIEYYTGMTLPQYDPDHKIIWLLGMAPGATLYIVKVFDHTGGSIPESLVLAGMEHALNLKLVQGYDVDIVTMSIGGATLYDGRDVEDKLVDTIIANGITLTAAAGNEGPAPMTVSSPGSAYTAITVGLAVNPVNTRVYWDNVYNTLGIGYYLFHSDDPQIYCYSSRGPSSDGRTKPTVSATGLVVLSAYITGGGQNLAWASGTSMATPAVAGSVALLNSYAEMKNLGASPEDYKQALTSSAIWMNGYTANDQGAGYIYVEDALTKLIQDTSYGDVSPPLPEKASLADITNIPIKGQGVYQASVTNLPPGQKADFIFAITAETDSVRVDITNLYLNPDENPLGLNQFEFYIQSAKRTTRDRYIYSADVYGDASFLITDDATTWWGATSGVTAVRHVIEPGYMKVTLENDFTSFEVCSADVKITVTAQKPPAPDVTIKGSLAQGDWTGWIKIPVPAGTVKAVVEVWWTNDWTKYPTSDMDMVIYWDKGYNTAGASMNSPERVVLSNPTMLYLYVEAYAVYVKAESFSVKIWFTI